MKLIGSKREQEIREQLIESNEALFKKEEKRRLLEIIHKLYSEMKTAYVIQWIPEQGEDIYEILINDSIIAEIEIERHNDAAEAIVESKTVSQYLKETSKQNRIKVAIALDLINKGK